MKKKYVVVCISVFLLTAAWGHFSFAQVPPEIPDGTGVPGSYVPLVWQDTLSEQALSTAKTRLKELKDNFQTLLLSSLDSNQNDIVNGLVQRINDRLENLESIKIYFVTEGASPGTKYQAVYDYYKSGLGKLTVFRDIEDSQFQEMLDGFPHKDDILPDSDPSRIHIDKEYKDIGSILVDNAYPITGTDYEVYKDVLEALELLIRTGEYTDSSGTTYTGYEVRSAAGGKEKTRVSIMNFYIVPDPPTFDNYTLHVGTTLVIATDL